MNYKGLLFVILGIHYSIFTLAQCPAISFNSVSVSHVTCYLGTNGSISLTPSGGTPPYTYYWSPINRTSRNVSGLAAGSYTVTATDANGCQGSRTFALNEVLPQGPVVTNATVCKGSTATLSATGAPIGGSYKWYTSLSGSVPVPGETSHTFITPTIKSTTTWYVSQVDASSCESARVAVVANMINPLYPMVDLDSSLIMHYKFDNNLVDSAGRNGDASRFNRTDFLNDRNSKPLSALRLDVMDAIADDYGYVDFPASPDLQALTNKITISLWIVRGVSNAATAPLVNKWESGSGFYIGSHTTNSSIFERKVLWKVGTAQMISDVPIPTNASWHHIVCVYTGSELQVYQDGIFAGSTPHAEPIPITAVNMKMGRIADGSDNSRFTGSVDELRIYNRALSSNEILTLYNDESVAFRNTPVCENGTVSFSTFSVPGVGFQWGGPGSFSSSTQNPVITEITLSQAGIYSLRVSKNGCTSSVQNAPVVVNPSPSTAISPSGPTTFCDGGSVTLTAPNAASWLWSTGATTRAITVSQSSDYTVEVTGTNGCIKTSDPFAVTVIPVNDAPSFTVGNDVIVNEDVAVQSISLWATNISAGPGEATQTVNFQVSNDNNALFSAQPSVNSSGLLTFTPASNVSGVAQVTLKLRDDGGTACGGTNQSANQMFNIAVNPVNDAPSFAKGGDIVTHEDASAQTITGWATNIIAGPMDESAQTVNFQVSNNSNTLFGVQPSVNAGGDLTFTPAPGATGSCMVTLYLQDNGGTANGGVDRSAGQTFTITLHPVNDAPSFTKGTDVVVNEDAGTQTVMGWATSISAGPNEGSQTLNFVIDNNNNTLFTVQPSINAAGDLTFTPAPGATGSSTITLYLQDNGGTANGGVDRSADQTFTITIDPVNDAPSFMKGTDVVVNEDAGVQTVSGWATSISAGPNEGSQTLNFVIDNNNNTLFAVQPTVNAEGDLTFTPAPDASGVAVVTLAVRDNGGIVNGGVDQSPDQTFTITIEPVNDAPSFTKGNDISINEDALAQVINSWASAMNAGPNETSQTLNFLVSNDNNTLFIIQPSINSAGDLSFTPAPNALGSATVTVVAQDNGGTANGGADRSTGQTFTITLNPVNDAPGFTQGPDVAVDEDAGPYNASWATDISAGEPNQTVTFVVLAGNTDLFAVQPSISNSGILSFLVRPDVSGASVVNVYLKDDGGTGQGGEDQSVIKTFNIVVNAVNDAPQIDQTDDLVIPVNSGPLTVNLTGIHPGIGEEDQQLNIQVTSGDPSILPDPRLTALQNGTISIILSPVANVVGTVTVTVKIKDNGGTTLGGNDETTISFLLIIEEEVQAIFLPNFFSPDNNGVNDAFRVRGSGIEQIHFSIYDTEGQQLFSTSDVAEATEAGWNGEYKGKDMPAGTYTWLLEGRYINGKPLTARKTQYGQVLLVR